MDSKSKIYKGLGYVVNDKAEDEYVIEVYPVEAIPTVNGSISYTDNGTVAVKDITGNNVSVKYDKRNSISCKWYPNGEQSRVTAPDVCKGDIVELYTFGDTDDYFWCVYRHSLSLRKREKVLYFFSNKAGVGDDDTKAYFLLIDTRNKKTHLHLDNSDGEAAGYDVLFDGAVGVVTVSDTEGNVIELASVKGKLTVSTNQEIEFNTKKATVNCESLTMNAKNDATINTNAMTINSSTCNIN